MGVGLNWHRENPSTLAASAFLALSSLAARTQWQSPTGVGPRTVTRIRSHWDSDPNAPAPAVYGLSLAIYDGVEPSASALFYNSADAGHHRPAAISAKLNSLPSVHPAKRSAPTR